MKSASVLFVDLDGTVRYSTNPSGFVNDADDVAIYPQAHVQLWRFKDAGWRIIAVTNQGGIALGHTTKDRVNKALERTEHLCKRGLHWAFDVVEYCPHHPDADDVDQRHCWCRKPYPGMAITGANYLGPRRGETYPAHMALFVGDRPEDEGAAKNMNVRFMHATDWRAGKFDPNI